MLTSTLHSSDSVKVVDCRCSAGPAQKPFTEMHAGYSVSYVRKGSFGYQSRGTTHELVAGSVLLGYPQDEFVCTHDHHVCGDECLAFQLSPGIVDLIENDRKVWIVNGMAIEEHIIFDSAVLQKEGRVGIDH
jgi:AraC family transcriptional regulator